ncbi:helix-hairpin-helix domain-containing protein [Variovorax saccharolyticus]|uniref:helix-hairpin-helix domain-containing protein n=1 Tax=Variovorax saccharolyticus TaxID=3053516 RepID=UPI002577ED65|nr:hypothetical protein [Variovorax sp. J31P216]MDM0029813.1 hypothetical protein [Variovorax sp. J31P216]
MTTGCFAVVVNTLRGLTKGQRVVHNQAPWTTLRCGASGGSKTKRLPYEHAAAHATSFFYDVVIQVAIVRPGPIQVGMMHPYLRRRMGEEAHGYPSDEIRQATECTLGIPLFQEQVMAIVRAAADFTAGEADQLRRALGAWRKRGGLEVHQRKLIERMLSKGYSEDSAPPLSKQVEGFGRYGFPESHAARFAHLVYVSCWLKRHHPDAMLAGLLNSRPMGFYAPAQLVRDAREHGVVVRPVDVTISGWDCTLEEPAQGPGSARWDTAYEQPWRAVRLGISRINGMREEATKRIVAARVRQSFASVEDLAMRAQLDAHDCRCLSSADALPTRAGRRPDAVWDATRGAAIESQCAGQGRPRNLTAPCNRRLALPRRKQPLGSAESEQTCSVPPFDSLLYLFRYVSWSIRGSCHVFRRRRRSGGR